MTRSFPSTVQSACLNLAKPEGQKNLLLVTVLGYVTCSQWSISLAQIFGFVGLAIWVLGIIKKQHQPRFPLILCFGCFVAAFLCSLAAAVDPVLSSAYFKRLLEPLIFFWALNVLTLISSANIEKSPGDTLFGRMHRWFLSLQKRPVTACLALMIFTASITVFSAIPQIYYWGQSYRVHGPWTNPMTYGVILMMVSIAAFGWVLHREKKGNWLLAGLVLLSIGILVTYSRNAWVGLLVALCFLFYFKNRRALWALPVFGIVAYGAAPDVIKDRVNTFSQFGEGGIQKRLQMWEAAVDVIRDHPVFGCGYQCLFKIQDQYPQHAKIFGQFQNMHSNYIQLTLDMGLVGLIAWLCIWVGYLIVMRNKWQAPEQGEASRCLILIASAEVVAFLIAGFFETHFYDQEIMMVFYILLALPFVKLSKADASALTGSRQVASEAGGT